MLSRQTCLVVASALLMNAGCGQLWFESTGDASVDAGASDGGADGRGSDAIGDASRLDARDVSIVDVRIIRDASVDAPLDSGPDVTADAGDPDAGVTCLWTGPPTLGEVVALDSINTSALESDPFLSPDGSALYFVSNTEGTSDLFRAEWSDTGFGAQQPVLGLSSPASDDTMITFIDDRTLLVGVHASRRDGGTGGSDLYRVSRPSVDAAFDGVVELTTLNTSGNEFDPVIEPSTGDLYFASDRNGSLDIFRAPALDEGWGPPMPVTGLNGASNESSLSFAPGGEHALFQTGNDVFYARHLGDGTFRTITPLPGITTSRLEAEPHITSDGCEVFFIRDVVGQSWDLHRARVSD